MQTSITLSKLGDFIVFVLILMVGGYLMVTLKNINALLNTTVTLNDFSKGLVLFCL
jgi:hypothetical protein